MISESRRFAISNVMLVLSIGVLAFVSMDSFGTGCANAATGSCQVGDTETFSADLGLGGDVIFEGATDDDFETSLTATDPTADRTITMPDYSGDLAVYTGGEGTAAQVLTSNGPGVAPSYQDIPLPDMSTGIEFEGATDDAFETTLAITDPTADRTVTVPNASGTIQLSSNAGTNGQVLTQSASGVPSYQNITAPQIWHCANSYTANINPNVSNTQLFSVGGFQGSNCVMGFNGATHGTGYYKIEATMVFYNSSSGTGSAPGFYWSSMLSGNATYVSGHAQLWSDTNSLTGHYIGNSSGTTSVSTSQTYCYPQRTCYARVEAVVKLNDTTGTISLGAFYNNWSGGGGANQVINPGALQWSTTRIG